MKTSYFAHDQRRIYAFLGAIYDLFVDESLVPLPLEEMLHRDLRLHGYERIIFMGFSEGAYFLDAPSRQLWHGKSAAAAPAPRLKSAFQGKLLGNQSTAAPAAPPTPQQELFFTLSAEEMLRYAGEFIRDSSVKTAVIFPDGLNMLEHFHKEASSASMLNDLFKKVESIRDIVNRNVLIFLFERGEDAVFDYLEGNRYVQEVLKDRTLRHYIPAVGEKEIYFALHYLRVMGVDGKKLRMDISQANDMSQMLAQKILRNINESQKEGMRQAAPGELKARQLKELMQYLLDYYMTPGVELNREACQRMCGQQEEKSALEQLDALIGMQAVKDAIRKYIALHHLQKGKKVQETLRLEPPVRAEAKNAPNLNFVLTGRKGTGKTTVAKVIGKIFAEYGLLPSGHMVETRPSELIGAYVGHSEANMRAAITRAKGGVLFIDEAYSFASKGEVTGDFKQGMVDELVGNMTAHKGEYAVVMAGYPEEMADMFKNTNPGLKERFLNHIHIEDYTPDELADIFRLMAKQRGLAISPELDAMLVSFLENWYYDCQNDWANARNVENLIGAMAANGAQECGCLKPDMIPSDLQKYASDALQTETKAQLDEMIGLHQVKQQIRDFENELIFGDGAQRKNYHFIFSGNPGTGKTTVAKLFGQLLKGAGVLKSGAVREVKAEELLKAPGALAQEISQCRDRVLFIDEAYQLLRVPMILDQLVEKTNPDLVDFPFTVICAGYEADMQDFLKYNKGMPRRFQVIHFDDYSTEELMQILEIVLKKNYSEFSVTEEFLQGAMAHFRRYKGEIAKGYNGGYVNLFLNEARKLLFRKFWEKYGEEKKPPKEEYVFTAAEVPQAMMNGIE